MPHIFPLPPLHNKGWINSSKTTCKRCHNTKHKLQHRIIDISTGGYDDINRSYLPYVSASTIRGPPSIRLWMYRPSSVLDAEHARMIPWHHRGQTFIGKEWSFYCIHLISPIHKHAYGTLALHWHYYIPDLRWLKKGLPRMHRGRGTEEAVYVQEDQNWSLDRYFPGQQPHISHI